jgi:hypothetical protein
MSLILQKGKIINSIDKMAKNKILMFASEVRKPWNLLMFWEIHVRYRCKKCIGEH